MNRSVQAAVAVLVLILGAAIGFRGLRPPVPPSPRPSPGAPEPSSSIPAVSPGDARCGSLALRWIGILQDQLKDSPPSTVADELSWSRQREIRQELTRRLAEEPDRWTDVLEALCEEDPRLGRRIVGELREAVGDGGEKPLILLLRSGRHRETRMSSATLIAGRNSPDCFWALVSAAQEDEDSGVRYQALSELAKRKTTAGLSQESDPIDQVFRLRAQIDPDPAVRQFALRVTGQSVESVPTTA